MKFRVTMKDPDTLQDAIADAVKDIPAIEGLTPGEMALVRERRRQEIADVCYEWFEYGEYLSVEIDTDAATCRVLGRKEMKP